MRYRTVIFDMDGTLIDTEAGIVASLRHTIEKNGLPMLDDASLRYFIGPPLRDSFAHFFALDPCAMEQVVADYRAHNHAHGLPMSRVFPGVADMLAALRARGLQLWVASTKYEGLVRETLTLHHLQQHFCGILGANCDGTGGDKAQLIARVLQQSDTAPADALMVGDRRFDMLGAQSAGLAAAAALWGGAPRAEFAFSNVVLLAHEPQEIAAYLQE